MALDALATQVLERLVHTPLLPRRDDNLGPLQTQPLGDPKADALGGGGDNHQPADTKTQRACPVPGTARRAPKTHLFSKRLHIDFF